MSRRTITTRWPRQRRLFGRVLVRKPNSVRHFFTADEQEFCDKAAEYGYPRRLTLASGTSLRVRGRRG